MTIPHILAAAIATPWAVLPDRLEAIRDVLERRSAGIRLPDAEIAAIRGARDVHGLVDLWSIDARRGVPSNGQASTPQGGMVAVINIMGVIAQHAHQVDNISGPGGTSCERVANSLRAALANPDVKAIVLNIDSPGGNVSGVQGLAHEIYRARGRKPIVAQANSMMASAAYWLGAAADEVVASPGAQLGSIGVYALHRDVSAAAQREGVKFTFISAGKYKVEGNQFEPLGDEARAAVQKGVNGFYNDFTGDIAKFRRVSVADVRNGFGQGRVEKDRDAVRAKLADRVSTLDDTLNRLASARQDSSVPRACAPTDLAASADMEAQRHEFLLRRHNHRKRSATPRPLSQDMDFRRRRHRLR